jgi:hypothetical protein
MSEARRTLRLKGLEIMRIEDEVWDDEDGDEDKLEVLKAAYEYEDETKHGVAIWFDEREEEEHQKEEIPRVRVSRIKWSKSKSLKRPPYPHRPNPPCSRPLPASHHHISEGSLLHHADQLPYQGTCGTRYTTQRSESSLGDCKCPRDSKKAPATLDLTWVRSRRHRNASLVSVPQEVSSQDNDAVFGSHLTYWCYTACIII